jgi:peptidyl-prolyl cis-trans isomerase B (cyclophilin B)
MKVALTFLACLVMALPLAAGFSAHSTALAHPLAVGGPEIKWVAPTSYLSGGAFSVHIELTAPAGGAVVAGWLLTPAAFLASGKALGEREEKGSMTLPEGAKISVDLDLGPYIKVDKDFKLVYASGIGDDRPVEVKLLKPAGAGLNFLDEKSVPLADLKKYNVLLQTNRGDMVVEFWPDVAPNHVRNYLDLAYTNFYSGTTFHRVIPSFMIQGGDPTGSGTGNGPRKLMAEFNDRKHERGVLSMARVSDPNSASCQFFVMHAKYPSLDGLYTAFGKLVSGYEALDAIVNSPRGQMDRPNEPQKIIKATVILAGDSK